MKYKYLLIGTSLSLFPALTWAQCVASQDCTALGYTETSCSGSAGVKCPFGNKWACFKSEAEFCNEYGFTQNCTGTEEIGVGKACNGKYYECACSNGYSWNNLLKKCEYDYQANCVIGALYYSDGTCSSQKLANKTLLGVVIYEKSASQNGWIMAINTVATKIAWGGYDIDIPELTNIANKTDLIDISASCTNTDIITARGDSSTYPAAWAAKNYKPAGTPSGKSWCLPSGGLLKNLENSEYYAKVNTGIAAAGGTQIGYGGQPSSQSEDIWSSSEGSSIYAWLFYTKTDGSFNIGSNGKTGYYVTGSVRPVMAF